MYQLTCPHCESDVPVSAAKAGDQVPCPQCDRSVNVPKLGELRQLPEAVAVGAGSAGGTSGAPVAGQAGLSGGRSMAFALLAFVSLVCMLGAVFCGINWATLDAPTTSQSHVAQAKEMYAQASSARLIREFEDITQYGVDIPTPYAYRVEELKKQAWLRNTLLFASGGLVAFSLAMVIGRRSKLAA